VTDNLEREGGTGRWVNSGGRAVLGRIPLRAA
jgi:hypothetical protein